MRFNISVKDVEVIHNVLQKSQNSNKSQICSSYLNRYFFLILNPKNEFPFKKTIQKIAKLNFFESMDGKVVLGSLFKIGSFHKIKINLKIHIEINKCGKK
ncbi:hypothetical protein BpHYR1_039564 [Brachionus plicatilis]|uniref:Uncharacterized protein n=1 Tax=Brachionus plicatilis TaxID=10195 RepID=A0A3M7QTV1_BRAPC|nr:hypothetical protein BpHYR1_039564 [Brachionus plicatilis]